MDYSKLPPHKREEARRRDEERRTKEVYQEFLETFEDDGQVASKTFVRGGVVNPGSSKFDGEGAVYKPPPVARSAVPSSSMSSDVAKARLIAEERARKIMQDVHGVPSKKSSSSKAAKSSGGGMSNLAAFKEELRQMQEARDERKQVRQQLRVKFGGDERAIDRIAPSLDNPYASGNFDHDPYTTNLFMGNLHPDLSSENLYEIFGSFGPLASVKIMWPRSDEDKVRGYNCGFIAFMTRVDADRAVAGLRGRPFKGMEMKLSFAKPVPIPSYPIYVPPNMMQLSVPPPPTGLPFNAQPQVDDLRAYKAPVPHPCQPPPSEPEHRAAWDKMIRNALVRVVPPTERPLLALIHRTVEFVVREGPAFEALLMNREMNNPIFRFLFDNQCPAHVYYRWRLYSVLQGEPVDNYSEKDFRMFKDGSLWRPPVMNFFARGMPKELYMAEEAPPAPSLPRLTSAGTARSPRSRSRSSDSSGSSRSRSGSPVQAPNIRSLPGAGTLSDQRRDALEDLLRQLTPERSSISASMLFCVDNADCAQEIVECLAESLSIKETPLHKKIARLYLVADILANCAAKVANVSFYRKFFSEHLHTIFADVGRTYAAIEGRLKAEQFKQRVMFCFRAWEEAALYPTEFLINLQNIFFGLVVDTQSKSGNRSDDDDELDGLPLEAGAAAKEEMDDDIDGAPIDDRGNTSGGEWQDTQSTVTQSEQPISKAADDKSKGGFVKSKWEEIDSKTVQQQAVTTSKWDEVDGTAEGAATQTKGLVAYDPDDEEDDDDIDGEDLDGIPMDQSPPSSKTRPAASLMSTSNQMTEHRRQAIRQIELKVVNYQDELEGGRRSLPAGCSSVGSAVAKFRADMLSQLEETEAGELENTDSPKTSSRSKRQSSRDKDKERDRGDRSDSHSKSRRRSRSSSRSRDRDRDRDRRRKRSRSPSKHKRSRR